MHRLGAMRHRARWAWWVARTRAVLRRRGVELVVDAAGPPTWDAPPVVELTRQPFLDASDGGGSLTLRVGHGVHLGRGLVLEIRPDAENLVAMGNGSWLAGSVRVALFGGQVLMGDGARLRQATLRCSGVLELGPRAGVHEHSVLHCAHHVRLGAGTLVTERCSVLDSEHLHDGGDEWFMLQGVALDETVLGDNVLVGSGSTVLAGARLGDGSVVAAGSVVRRGEHPGGSLLAGAPARVIRSLAPVGDPT